MDPEVIVIGGGVIGSSITYHLAKDGVKVTQVEKGSIANEGAASRASAGGIRLNNRDPRELELAKESIRRWEQLEEELEADLEYRPLGQIMLYDESFEEAAVKKQLAEDLAQGIQGEFLAGSPLQDLVPGLSPHFDKALYYPVGGQGNGQLTALAYSAAARRLGATILTGTEISDLVTDSGKITGVKIKDKFLPCQVVVNAAGIWAKEIHRKLGLELSQIKPMIHQMSASYPAPLSALNTPTIGARGRKISLKQTIDGRIRAGGGYQAKAGPSPYLGRHHEAELQEQRQTVLELFPHLEKYPVDFTYHGVEAHCLDHIPILGGIKEVSGYVIAAGFSGHGFTLSPAIGQVMAELVQGKSPSLSIDAFHIDRDYVIRDDQGKYGNVKHVPG